MQLLQIGRQPDSPVNEGRLCPEAPRPWQPRSKHRVDHASTARPAARPGSRSLWDDVLDRVAGHIKESRDRTFVTTDAKGRHVNRTEGIAFAGGATFSNEEGYLAAKVMRSLGLIYLEQQARV